MKNAILIHGCCDEEEFRSDKYPSSSNNHWLPWLQRELMKAGIETQTPEMPQPYRPRYEEWKRVFEYFLVGHETILIGHSCGAGFLLRWLSNNKKKVAKLILVAPYLDGAREYGEFLKQPLEPSIGKRVGKIFVLYSTDESVSGVKESVEKIATVYPTAEVITFDRMGHFTLDEMRANQFPQLLRLATE